jgi:hypothetical protein
MSGGGLGVEVSAVGPCRFTPAWRPALQAGGLRHIMSPPWAGWN